MQIKWPIVILITSCLITATFANDSTESIKPMSLVEATCKGAFDVYFVLDKSSSLFRDKVNHFKTSTASFVTALTEKFTSPLLRLSYITFSDDAEIVMQLTNDRKIVEEKLVQLANVYPEGTTHMHLGIKLANDQIVDANDQRASVIIVLTDGKLDYITKKLTVEEAERSRRLGATVFTVGVSSYDQRQLLAVAGSERFVFEAADFSGLNRIGKEVIDGSCVEVHSVEPNIVCSNESFTLGIYGKGFSKTGTMEQVRCNFYMRSKPVTLVIPTEKSDTYLKCPSPDDFVLQDGDEVTVQISLNGGLSFVSSNVTVTSYSCNGATTSLFVVIAFLFVLLLVAIWWFWNALCCVVTVDPKPEVQKPVAPPPPLPMKAPVAEVRQWPAVSASFYGGRGAGGIKPVPVQWGDKGCTEAALHLERTKDAEEVAVIAKEVIVERPVIPPTPVKSAPKPTGCFAALMGFFAALFAPLIMLSRRLSLKRPNRDDVGKCILIKRNNSVNATSNINSSAPSRGSYLDTTS